MTIYPASAEEKLGFDTLRVSIASLLLSPMGHAVFARRKPAADLGWIRDELSRVRALQDVLRFDDPLPLYPLRDISEPLRDLGPQGATVEPEALLDLLRVLEGLRLLRGYFTPRAETYPQLFEVVKAIVPMPDLEKRISEVVDDDGSIKDTASSELRRLRKRLVSTQARLRESLLSALSKSVGQGYTTESQPTIRSGRMVIPVRAEAKRKVSGFVHDVSASGQTVYIEPAECLDLNNEVRAVEAEEHHEIRRILIEVASQLRGHLDEIRKGLQVFGVVDFIHARARLANILDARASTINDAGKIVLIDARNPVLQLHLNAQGESAKGTEALRQIIPLNLTLGDESLTLILTGPNAGGKTVAMKTIGLFSLMLAYGIPVPADEKSEFAVFSHLIVDIGDEQSIENDLSTFSSHVTNLRYMVEHASEGTLVLIDEAGTGTDPAEGAALAQVIFETLTKAGARTIATTHHGSLKVFAHDTPLVENGSMQFDQETLRPTYRLQQGIPGSSYAFEIASRIGLDQALLERARGLLGEQTARLEDLIGSLETRNQRLATQLEEAEKQLSGAQQQRSRYERLMEQLEAQQDEIKEKALADADAVVREANAQVERTIREIKEHQAAKEATRQARSGLDAFKEKIQQEKQHTERKNKKRAKRKAPRDTHKQEPATISGPLAVGDQVILDGGSTTAELLELDGNNAVIMAGSMHMRVKTQRLTKVAGPKRQQVTIRQVHSEEAGSLGILKAHTRIDLRGKRVDEALAAVTRFVDDAIAANLNRAEIVHGKGTGALRLAIHELLNNSPEISRLEEAPWDEGGPGVTYVYLK